MKVLMAAPHTCISVGGGASVQLLQTKKYLPDFGIEAGFFNPWEKYSKERVDLVHIFEANMATHDFALRLKDLGIPFVVSPIFFTLHRPGFLRFSQTLENISKRVFKGIWTGYGIIGAICQASSGVLPNTSEEARLVKKGLGISKEKIRIIPNGVEERFCYGNPDTFIKKYGVKDFILNVANIGSFRKNALSLIRALNKIDHPAVIIGKIFHNAYADQCLAEARKNKNLLIIGDLPNNSAMLESAYAASDTFVLPAYFETPGIAALEAALAGAKIVITRYGGTRDYFQNEAAYVDPASVNSIVRGIEQALNQKKNESLKERIRREYLWPKVSERTAAAYRASVKR
jgi:glycosyltransferase involved in cell wall biosynthesis